MTPLHGACYFGRFECCEFLIKEGADINAYSYFGKSIFQSNLTNEPTEPSAVSKILKYQEEPKHTSKWATPLHFAASNGHKDICLLLLECGADGQARDYKGYTACQIAKLQSTRKLLN